MRQSPILNVAVMTSAGRRQRKFDKYLGGVPRASKLYPGSVRVKSSRIASGGYAGHVEQRDRAVAGERGAEMLQRVGAGRRGEPSISGTSQ